MGGKKKTVVNAETLKAVREHIFKTAKEKGFVDSIMLEIAKNLGLIKFD